MNEDLRIGQLLLKEGVITEEDLKKALEAQKESFGKPLGEVMIGLGMISEADFLRVLARKFHTQYLTTQKLSKLKVPEAVLKLVPEQTAVKFNLFPVQYKRSENSLTIVMTNPQDVAAVDEVRFVSGVPNIKTLVGLKDAIKASIDKWYHGDEHAFEMLLGIETEDMGYGSSSVIEAARELEKEGGPLDLESLVTGTQKPAEKKDKEQQPVSKEEIILGADSEGVFLGGMDQMPGDDNQARDQIVIEELSGEEPVEEISLSPVSSADEVPQPEPEVEEVEAKPLRRPDLKKYRRRMLVVEPHPKIRDFFYRLFTHEGFQVKCVETREQALEELEQDEYDSLVIKDKDAGEGDELANLLAEKFPEVELCSIKDYGSAVIGETRAQKRLTAAFLETLDIVIGLLEMEAGGMQGHSHNVAKYARLIASKLDLPQREVDTITLAAHVHDLGKKGMKHYTLYEINKDADPEEIMEQAEIPLRLLSAAKFPLDIAATIRHQYEKWDGSGIPDGLKGEEIPVGARILALAEAFEHLTNRYSGGPALEPSAALEKIRKDAGVLFDPQLVEILLGVVRDDLYIQQMAGEQDRILIVDKEVDFMTLLELRLINMSYLVSLARSAEEGVEKAKADHPSLIIAEVELPDKSGFEMIQEIKNQPELKDVPFVLLSRNDSAEYVDKSFKLGAEDFIAKPIKVDILGAKIHNMMTRLKAERKAAPATAGVSGQLSEMDIPAIIQILGAGRKTGRITLRNNGKTATIDMEDGRVVNAAVDDLKGEEAFYQILYWTEGTFTIDPNVEIKERLITLSNDSLMLEGFRRMDEANRDKGPEEDIQLDGSDFF